MAQPNSLIGFAFIVDQQRKLDPGFLAEEPGIAGVAQADHGQMSAFLLELSFKFAQLRDMLSAENSTVMTKEDHHGRSSLPQGAKPRRLAIGVRERDSSQLAAERLRHAGHSLGSRGGCQDALLTPGEQRNNCDA